MIGVQRMSELWERLDRDNEIDEIAKRILREIQSANSKKLLDSAFTKYILQLSDLDYTKNMLKNVESASARSGCELEKIAVIKALILSTWMQRLYFIIRSFLMGQIAAVIAFFVVWYLESINVIQNVLLGTFVFISGLLITRLFDAHITGATKRIVNFLSKKKRVRDFIMNHF
jgi:hypothetical protein